jgi:GTP cyclohydrolase I
LQETLVENVANALCEHLGAAGAMCIAELRPTCLTVRGERESWAQAISVGSAGNMRAGQALHASALALLQKR